MDPGCFGAVVSIDHLSKRFEASRAVLDDVSCEIGSGEFAVITGPSGSGKTTLLNLVAGFDTPDTGRVLVDGTDVSQVPDIARFRRETIAVVFQMHHLIPGLTATENVELPLLPTTTSHAERRRRALAALAQVGLEHAHAKVPHDLSGGERQRVAIARAIVMSPRLLLADEPTGLLDSETGAHILELLITLCRRRSMTLLMVTYDRDAARQADRVLYLRDGRLGSAPDRATRATLSAAGD